ncbi:MAG: DUF2029 domain-containing protein [Acidobacteriota bacterium]|nr:DUF2029 domain-containing protein [Acidobacteriota bacterium]
MREEPLLQVKPDAAEQRLEKIFLLLFAQIVALILLSFLFQQGVQLIWDPFYFGLDFKDFYRGFVLWIHGQNPMDDFVLSYRLTKPPFSLAAGGLFAWTSFGRASVLFFLLNLGLVGWSVDRYARELAMLRRSRQLLLLIAAIYYPVYFLVERGNLDGLMLALVVLAFTAQNRLVRTVALGASIGMKLYTGVLAAVWAYQRKWRAALAAVAAAVVLQLPFYRLFVTVHRTVDDRFATIDLRQNMSPGSLLTLGYMMFHPELNMRVVNLTLVTIWLLTLGWKVWRSRRWETPRDWVLYLPWLVAYPALVYPYTGVFLLLVLAYVVQESRGRKLRDCDQLLLAGFLLTGVQSFGWTHALEPLSHGFMVVHLLNAIGTTLMLLGACTWQPANAPQVAAAV